MNHRNKIYEALISLSIIIIVSISACKKQVEVEAPYNTVNAGNVFNDDATAKAALIGIYTEMSRSLIFSGNASITIFTGLSSDEFTLFSGVTDLRINAYYANLLVSNPSRDYGSESWKAIYPTIYYCNAAIEGLSGSTSLIPSIKNQLLGEAKFLRAFYYFYLVNLYGELPLALSTDYKVNRLLSRSTKENVYSQIIADLTDAYDLLSIDYLDGNLNTYPGAVERVRPTKSVVAAFLARVYLFQGNNYANVESKATEVINRSIYSLDSLNDTFLKNSKEAIWQLQPINSGRSTEDARTFILTSTGPTTNTTRPVYLCDALLNSFEPGDLRKTKWINSVIATGSGIKYYYPFKYKNNGSTVTEYLMVLRLGEQYLIRAEARIQQGNTSGALSDLNAIRNRAGLPDYSGATDKNSLLAAILHERQVELFTESGHRWLDLKRTGTVDALMTVMTPQKSGGVVQWNSYKQLFPIPFTDIERNRSLTQNSGY